MQRSRGLQTFLDWAKRNMTLIIIITCVVAISAILIVAGLSGNKTLVLPPIDPDKPVVITKEVWTAPTSNYTIGMDYSDTEFTYNETLDVYEAHKAIDFKVSAQSDVFSVCDGVVKSIVTNVQMGTTVVIEHADGITATYSSLSDTVNVVAEQAVKKGDKIGLTSDTGYYEFNEGSHLHFSMVKDGGAINPKDIIKNL